MIIVTGTKRSGTSMWMQILAAAGFPLIGEAFPRNWRETIEAANPLGFYESQYRRGVFYATNPDPYSGVYLPPDATRTIAVKVFVPGLCRTDLAFVNRVVGTVRHWREYAGSVERLRAMENDALTAQGKREGAGPAYMDPVLEWWLENFALLRDIVTRKYAAHLVAYENVIEDPQTTLPPILKWLGAPQIDAAVAAVVPEARTQDRARIERDHECSEVFDELYALVANRQPITNEFLERINETHVRLVPLIESDIRRVLAAQKVRRAPVDPGRDPLHPDSLESLIHQDPEELTP